MRTIGYIVKRKAENVKKIKMLLILTHENADFDAISSMVAAARLYPDGQPLLPRRINRNVRQFLNLYWDADYFVLFEDWHRQRVERVILVDTMSLPNVRGLKPEKVAVQVIDHHELLEAEKENWRYHLESVGATTTLLVEKIRAAGLILTVNEATLHLLGIYEDTGSLSYDATTPRDVQAAAWLLEQGADLSIARRFQNIPLSEAQQQLYKRLREAVEWHRVAGQIIALSAVEAPENFEDEISAIAHHMRDELACDGLILLVKLKPDYIQLVARSMNDYIDVGALARTFDGGGHERAAAATILKRELEAVRAEVLSLLPEHIRPMATVAQIMSYGVRTIPATTTVEEAAVQMQRSGHEGYPVVDPESGRLVGLLTRRAVDRAVSHQLQDLPVSQVMRAGLVTVRPSDSVKRVQRLMIEEGWGQVPVLEDGKGDNGERTEDGRLIGIVTRTDIINLLNESGQSEEETNLRQLMANSLPPAVWGMVKATSGVAAELEMPLYFVGGLVRDLLLDKRPTDIDMVVEGDAIRLARRLRRKLGGETRSHAQFGTAKWLLTPEIWRKVAPDAPLDGVPEAIDFVTARTEFYNQPSALPEVERGSIKLDLHRRDFTINTLAIRLDGAHLGKLLDFYGGRRDLEQGIIRVLHSLSFVDDPTRILRAIRLEQRLNFMIEPRSAELIASALPMLDRVTGDRIRHEIELALEEADPVPVMERLAELGVMAQIHPGLLWQEQVAQQFRRLQNDLAGRIDALKDKALTSKRLTFYYFALWLLPLPGKVQEEVMERLKVRKTTEEDVRALVGLLHELAALSADARPSEVYKVLQPYRERVLLSALIAVGPDSVPGEQVEQYLDKWQHIELSLNGNDLMAMGVPQGPEIGRLLAQLLAARLDGEITAEDEERAFVDTLRSTTSEQ
jgi:tRNA nucleotidyltransferase (CCA-adding enzyme)